MRMRSGLHWHPPSQMKKNGSPSTSYLTAASMTGSRWSETRMAPQRPTVSLPGGPGRLEVWLPHEGSVVLNELSLTEATYCQAVPPRKKWLTYGSSITHCIEADGPSQTWPALVARKLDFELYALGMAGHVNLVYAIDQTTRARDVAAIPLSLGI